MHLDFTARKCLSNVHEPAFKNIILLSVFILILFNIIYYFAASVGLTLRHFDFLFFNTDYATWRIAYNSNSFHYQASYYLCACLMCFASFITATIFFDLCVDARIYTVFIRQFSYHSASRVLGLFILRP